MRAKDFIKEASTLDQMIQKASGPQAAAAQKPSVLATVGKEVGSLAAGVAQGALAGFKNVIGAKNTNIKAPRDAEGNVITKNTPAQPDQQQQQPAQQQQQKPASIAPQVSLKQAAGNQPVNSTGNPKVDAVLRQQGVQVK